MGLEQGGGTPKGGQGLSPQHHGELNSWKFQQGQPAEQRDAKLAGLRQQYSGDSKALQQIDVYNGHSEYNAKLKEYTGALKSGNEQKAGEIESWMHEHYPDV